MGSGSIASWPWLGFLFIVVVSGLIAYVGDYIGRRIGRKRLTIFGLRPKSTAILFTIITGAVIAIVTTAAVLAVSEDARERILGYTEIVTRLEQQAAVQHERRQRAEDLAAAAQAQKQQAERALVTAEQAARRAETAQGEAEQRSAGAVELARRTQAQVVAARRELSAARQRRDTALARVKSAEAAVDKARRAERELDVRLRAARAELDERLEEIEKANREIQNAFELLKKGRQAAEETEAQVAELQAALDKGRRERDQLLQELDRSRAEARRLREVADQLRAEAMRSGSGEVIVEYGSELARTRFRESLTRDRIEEQLDTLLRAVERKAVERGAGADERYGGDHAVLFGVARDGTLIAGATFKLDVVEFLAASGRSVWVRAIALRNSVAGQPVYYSLQRDADRLVFRDGEVLATATVDGRDGEGEVGRRLDALIRDQVNPLAEKRGLLPNPDEKLTVIGPETWFPALRQIKDANRPVTVRVVAVGDIRNGDSLAIAFEVADESG